MSGDELDVNIDKQQADRLLRDVQGEQQDFGKDDLACKHG